jgi:hypothetical protein
MTEHTHPPSHHEHRHCHPVAYYIGPDLPQWQFRATWHTHEHDHSPVFHEHAYTVAEEDQRHHEQAHEHEHEHEHASRQ